MSYKFIFHIQLKCNQQKYTRLYLNQRVHVFWARTRIWKTPQLSSLKLNLDMDPGPDLTEAKFLDPQLSSHSPAEFVRFDDKMYNGIYRKDLQIELFLIAQSISVI